jgi:hypothetical protein
MRESVADRFVDINTRALEAGENLVTELERGEG